LTTQAEGHIYGRIGNPTVERFETLVAELEKGEMAVAFASGMAAVTGATQPNLKAGDHIICSRTMYGPSIHVFTNVYSRYGIECTVVDSSDTSAVKAAVKPGKTKIVYIETPGNPLTNISDIHACAEIAHAVGAILVVDNTFASPIFQRPLDLGADISLHSVTKYLNGHGDVVGGVVICKTKELGAIVKKYRQDCGAIMGPFDAFLVTRGIRTLALRMEKHNANALAVAKFLQAHPKVAEVTYPGLESNPGHKLATQQMRGFGGTFSFIMKGGFEAAKRTIEHCKFCTLAVSLGCADTLIEHPASMTHAGVPPALMKEQGLCPELIRISVGIEDVEDIIEDLRQALEFA